MGNNLLYQWRPNPQWPHCRGCNRFLTFPENHYMYTCDSCLEIAYWDDNGNLRFDENLRKKKPTPFEEVMQTLARLNPGNPKLDKFRSKSK